MVSAENKAKRLLSVNHTTKTIHHHHHRHHQAPFHPMCGLVCKASELPASP